MTDQERYVGPPVSGRPAATCPRCGSYSQFDPPFQVHIKLDDHTGVSVRTCCSCAMGTIVIERGDWRAMADRQSFQPIEPVTWWPSPGGAHLLTAGAAVPAEVIDSYDEGMRALAVRAPHAAVVTFRTTLAMIANDKGGSAVRAERQLSAKLKMLRQSHLLLKALDDYTDAISALGNVGAHQEDWDPVSMDQANNAGELTRWLIHVLYEIPAETRRQMPATRW
jgi:hypothetical protein